MKLNFLRAEGTNKAILLSMSFSLLSKMFNFAQSLVVSYAFGTQTSTDILFYMLAMVILFSTLLSSVNQQVVVPNVIYIRTSRSEEDSRSFISYIYFLYLLIGIAATLLLVLWPDRVLELFSRFGREQILDNMDILRYIMPTFILIISNTFILDIFTAYRYFTLPMLLDMGKNLVIILFVLVFREALSVSSLALGVLMGNLLQFLALNYMLFSVLKCRPSLKRYPLDSTVKKNILYVVVGHLTTFLSNFAAIYLMSGFSEGVYSALDYGQKINTIFSLVIIGQITTVVGMNILELYAAKNHEKLNETFVRYIKMSLFFTIPFSFIVSLNSEGIISLLFQRGRFTLESVELTGGFLRFFVLTLPYLLINSFIVKLIVAKQIQRVAFWWQASQSAGNVIVLWVMISLFGYMGYPIGGLIASYTYILLLLNFLLKQQFGFIRRKEVIKYFLLNMLLASGIGAGFLLAGLEAGAGGGFFTKLIKVLWTSLAFLAAYLVLGYVTGLNRSIIGKLAAAAGSFFKGGGLKLLKE